MDDHHVMPHGSSALPSIGRSLVDSAKPFTPTRPRYSLVSFYSLLVPNLTHTRIGKVLPMYAFLCMCKRDAEGRRLHFAELFLQSVEKRRRLLSRINID